MRLLHYSDIENVHDDPARVGRLAGVLASLDGEDALSCGTGDNFAPGVLSLVTRGDGPLEFFDAAEPDLATFGNHDFDFGADRTREIVERTPQEWITANIYEDDERFAGADPWTVRELDGHRIGFIGVTDPTTPAANPSAKALTFTDPIAAVETATERLDEIGVDYTVVLSHLGRGDERLAGACDVDVILGGHVHSERIERVDGTVLTRPGSGGATVLELDLETGAVTRHAVADGPLDAALAARYRRHLDDAGLDTVLARVDEPIRRTEREAFRGESRVGNFVADAYRWAVEVATDGRTVIGLQNSGGIRTGPPLVGDVTVSDLISLVPFDEALVAVELTGAELRRVFSEAAQTQGFGEADWWHAHVSGAVVHYDHSTDELVEAQVLEHSVEESKIRETQGTLVDETTVSDVRDEERYLLATTEFLLHTDAEFPTITEAARVVTLETQYDVLAAYAEERGIAPTLTGRIVRTGL